MTYIKRFSHKIVVMTTLILFLSLLFFLPEAAHSFWKTCMKVDSSFYHQIIDPDIIEIGNNEYFAFVTFECEGVPRKNAFSRCANGCPLFPNCSVKIARNKVNVCEGDTIFVGSDQCTLGKIKKERWPER